MYLFFMALRLKDFEMGNIHYLGHYLPASKTLLRYKKTMGTLTVNFCPGQIEYWCGRAEYITIYINCPPQKKNLTDDLCVSLMESLWFLFLQAMTVPSSSGCGMNLREFSVS
jgi:hypothetical protein